MEYLEWSDFEKVSLNKGTIIKAEVFKEARKPAYKLWVDFGEPIGVKKSSAQITEEYSIDDLIGKEVMAVTNFKPKQIGPFMSECLVCGFQNENGDVILAVPDKTVPDGRKLH